MLSCEHKEEASVRKAEETEEDEEIKETKRRSQKKKEEEEKKEAEKKKRKRRRGISNRPQLKEAVGEKWHKSETGEHEQERKTQGTPQGNCDSRPGKRTCSRCPLWCLMNNQRALDCTEAAPSCRRECSGHLCLFWRSRKAGWWFYFVFIRVLDVLLLCMGGLMFYFL